MKLIYMSKAETYPRMLFPATQKHARTIKTTLVESLVLTNPSTLIPVNVRTHDVTQKRTIDRLPK
jgi:hypothetical protein